MFILFVETVERKKINANFSIKQTHANIKFYYPNAF